MPESEYLMEPRSDGVEMTVAVMAANAYRPPRLVVRDGHVNTHETACITPEIARALVRALLPLCPQPLDGEPEYRLFVRDRELVAAALRVLAPVMAIDEPRADEPF